MKSLHENWIRDRRAAGQPMQVKLSQLNYINVPRLSVLAAAFGIAVDMSFMRDTQICILWDGN